jgi:hypothetical protein
VKPLRIGDLVQCARSVNGIAWYQVVRIRPDFPDYPGVRPYGPCVPNFTFGLWVGLIVARVRKVSR